MTRTSLGDLTLVATGDRLTGVYFPHHWYRPDPATFGQRVENDAVLRQAGTELAEYLAGERREFDIAILLSGNDFQRRVWGLVAAIGYGEVRTYGDLAGDLDEFGASDVPMAKRVGQAVGRNPLSIIVPCHRVVGANGKLTGYAGGRDRKRMLLELEERCTAGVARLF